MINQIEKTYLKYKEIYKLSFSIGDVDAQRLLQNSLYLSVFTLFESFLKAIIKDYVKHKVSEQYKAIDFSKEVVDNILYDQKDIFESFVASPKSENRRKSFNKIYKLMTTPIEEGVLSQYICFKFLHKEELENHYNKIFQELVGDAYFLRNFKVIIVKDILFNSLEENVSLSAFDFIAKYADEVRNAIAHQNDSFAPNYSFNESVEAFLTIIKEINNKYTSYTSYTLTPIKDNLLDAFLN